MEKTILVHRGRALLSKGGVLLAVTLGIGICQMTAPSAHAYLTARYGAGNQAVPAYRTALPIGARPVLINGVRLYLADGIYYRVTMIQGQVVYIPVDTTWQRQLSVQ